MSNTEQYDRYFLSYTGVKLPLQLVSPIEQAETENRNTYFGAQYDDAGRLTLVRKLVYGEIELEHRYNYHDSGAIRSAEIVDEDEETMILTFNEAGERV